MRYQNQDYHDGYRRDRQEIVQIRKSDGHSFHQPELKDPRRKKLILIVAASLLAILAVWGIRAFWIYREKKSAQENYDQGMQALKDGDFNTAADKLARSIKNGNDGTEPLLKLAISKYNQRDYEGAIGIYMKILESDPLNVTANNGLGNVYRDQKNYDKAQEQYEKVIQIEPSFIPAYANLSIMLLDLGRQKEAKDVIQRGLNNAPESTDLKNISSVISGE